MPSNRDGKRRFTPKEQIGIVVFIVVLVAGFGTLVLQRDFESTASLVAATTIITTIRFM